MATVKTQADLDAAIAAGVRDVTLSGDGDFAVTENHPITLRTSGSSQPRVVAYDSSQPRIVAYGSSQPRIEAYGSSQPRVVASGSSQPRVVASGSSQVSTAGVVAVDVAPGSQVSIQSDPGTVVTGVPAVHVTRRQPTSIEAWCQEWGVCALDGAITLYKAVRDNYRSAHGGDYTPGTVPVAADWDGGDRECGGGLHACARPALSWQFDRDATRFIAVRVALVDIRAPKPGDAYPQKVKFRASCAPCVEVDLDGEPVQREVTR